MNLDLVLEFFANFFGRIFVTLNAHGNYPVIMGRTVSLYTILFAGFIISIFVNVWWKGARG